MRFLVISLLLSLFAVGNVYAGVELGDFSDYTFKSTQYSNRIRLSTNISDYDFLDNSSSDYNNDGVVDYLETGGFFNDAESVSVYVGNEHTRYDMQNALLWVGVDGSFNRVNVDGTSYNASDAYSAGDVDIRWLDNNLKDDIDNVFLFDVGYIINNREKDNSISSCSPGIVQFSDYVGSDDTRFYIGGLGSIKSGFNSYTPADSTVLWAPGSVSGADTPVAPEPVSLLLFSLGGVSLGVRKYLQR